MACWKTRVAARRAPVGVTRPALGPNPVVPGEQAFAVLVTSNEGSTDIEDERVGVDAQSSSTSWNDRCTRGGSRYPAAE